MGELEGIAEHEGADVLGQIGFRRNRRVLQKDRRDRDVALERGADLASDEVVRIVEAAPA